MAFNQLDKPQAGETIAIMKTNFGVMKLRLFPERVGECATNFIELAKQGKYDGAPFHRIISGFMIQGGDFTNRNGTGGHAAGGPGTTIDDKYDPCLTHMRGALAWAKTMMPHSIGSQFYIVHGDDVHFLDHPANGGKNEGYSVFGQLYEGFEVLDEIAGVKTDRRDAPFEDVTIESVTIETV
ncbi:MAG: peptidylprolyl isomerase [Fibrobacter sp.]|nr:peptidylprolyl isomerase [Fibrobacter sp.]